MEWVGRTDGWRSISGPRQDVGPDVYREPGVLVAVFDGEIVGVLIGASLGIHAANPQQVFTLVNRALEYECEVGVENRIGVGVSVSPREVVGNSRVDVLNQQQVVYVRRREARDWDVGRKCAWGSAVSWHF